MARQSLSVKLPRHTVQHLLVTDFFLIIMSADFDSILDFGQAFLTNSFDIKQIIHTGKCSMLTPASNNCRCCLFTNPFNSL